MRIAFFVQLECQTSTITLSLGINYILCVTLFVSLITEPERYSCIKE